MERPPWTRARRTARALCVLLGMVACSSGPASPASSVRPPATPSASAVAVSCAARVLATLDEDQRVGQLLFMGLANNRLGQAERDAIAAQHVGSVWYTELSGADSSSVAAVSASAQALAGRIPLLVGANQEGGQLDQFHGPGFTPVPSAAVQGQVAPAELRTQASVWGRELLAAGVNLDLAPVMDTVPAGTDAANAPIGALQRSFGHDPSTVSAHGVAFIQGMQSAGEAVVAKHFPGLGRVTVNTDFGASAVDGVTGPDDPYLQPFAAAVAAGADMVMVSTALYPRIDGQHLAAFSPAVIGLLRGRLGFGGVVVADDLGAAAAVQDVPAGERAVDFVAAGGDLVTVKYASLVAPMAAALKARAASDPAFRQRVDDSARRVLEVKTAHHPLCA